mmetsp:Transcript_77115/g.214463  ORF Transcript_77115/g.214463 Transcript_77115/m.214463 type:complete len:273 (+) Transcript_77115:1071-1889(+)
MGRFPENVAVHQLPARLFGCVFRAHVVVLRNIAVKRAEEDHGDHPGEEENDHQRIDDGKPMDLAFVHLQVRVPTGRPTDWAFRPSHVVRIGHYVVDVEVEARGQVLYVVAQSFGFVADLLRLLLQALWINLETDNAVTLELRGILVKLKPDPNVIVDEVPPVALDADWKAVGVGVRVVAPPVVAHGRGQIVHKPIHLVLVVDHSPEFLLLLLIQFPLAQKRTRAVNVHPDVVHRILNGVSQQDFTEILGRDVDLRGLAKWQDVITVWQLSLH